MKRILLGLIIVFTMAGCSGIQATKPMETVISNNAAVAAVQLSTDQTLESAKQGMADNAITFKVYFDAATINIFAYWFVPEKQIYCTARYYNLLNKNEVASRVFLQNVNAGSYTDDVVKGLYAEELKWMQAVNDAVQGSGIQR